MIENLIPLRGQEIPISSWASRDSGIEQEEQARLDVLGLGRDLRSVCSQAPSLMHDTAPDRKDERPDNREVL